MRQTVGSKGWCAVSSDFANTGDDETESVSLAERRARVSGVHAHHLLDDVAREEMSLLALQEIDEGNPSLAIELCEQLIAFHDSSEGSNAESTMIWRGVLGRALNEAELHDRAEAVLRALVADRTRILGPDHRATFVARGNLYRAIGFSGRTSEALDSACELLADRERVLGPDDADTLRSRGTIARLRLIRGEEEEGMKDLEDVYDARVRALGHDHPDTVQNLFNLTVRRVGSAQNLAQLDKAIDETIARFGGEHPAAFIIRDYRPRFLDKLGLHCEAHDDRAKLHADLVRALGELHPSAIASGADLATSTWNRGDLIRARQMQNALVRVTVATLGERHPQTLKLRTDLLVMQSDQISDDEYWQTYEELVDDALVVFDEASPGWERIASLHPELFEDTNDDGNTETGGTPPS